MNLKRFLSLLAAAIFFMPAQIEAAPMTLSVHEADLRSTIMLVAKTGGLNVSVDDSVKGTISISVENVEPLKLLEIISRTKSGKTVSQNSSKNIKYLSIKPVYLKDGSYRVKILIGSYVMWSSFQVNGESVNMNFDNLQRVVRPVSVQTRAFDAKTGDILTAKTRFTVLYNGKYLPFDQVPQRELVSGKIMKIHAECEGYKLKEFSMIIDWYQDSLFVNAGLEK